MFFAIAHWLPDFQKFQKSRANLMAHGLLENGCMRNGIKRPAAQKKEQLIMRGYCLIAAGLMFSSTTGCEQPQPPNGQAPIETRKQTPATNITSPPQRTVQAEVSFDTPQDREFAKHVAESAGELVQKIAVGIERKGTMRLQLGQATEPEDTLPLTKSILTGARKNFPGKPITLSVFDPQGDPVLKAKYHPDHGVRYEVVREGGATPEVKQSTPIAPSALEQSGTTEKDRQFAQWAVDKAKPYLRYVQADLEQRSRVWFGVTHSVKPEDVRDLTKSLLQGARNEFGRKELTATVFDPDGERIGKATLSLDGQLRWSK
jgi:hypothetical protein